MLGGSCLASSIELHCGFTAPDVHQVQSATASQEVLSLLSWQTALTGSGTDSSWSLSQAKMLGGSYLASSIELHCGLTAPDVHQVQSATASHDF